MLLKFKNATSVRQDIVNGDLSQVVAFAKDALSNDKKTATNRMFDMIDTAALNPVWRSQFERAFNKELGAKAQFSAFTDTEKDAMDTMKQFTITGGVSGTNIDGLFETNILPIIDGLLFDNSPVLSRVSIIEAGVNNGTQAFKLNEFAAEIASENLDEDDAGTEADDTPRTGDTLTPDNKIQASTSFTEYALMTMEPSLLGQFVARLIKRVQNRLVLNIFSGSNASNQFKGIVNTAGSGVDDQEGALEFTGTGDNVNKVLELAGDLPDAVTEGEESRFAYYMTRSTWYNSIRTVQDLDNNYKIDNVIQEIGGTRTINGLPVVFVGFGVAADRVVLADLSYYYMARKGSVMFKTDEGLANVKTGNVTAVARIYADGGMAMAHKNVAGGSADANDNQDRNMFRYMDL